MWSKLKSKKWRILQGFLIVCVAFALIVNGVVFVQQPNGNALTIGGQKAITIGMTGIAYAAGTPDYTCDGVADDIQFQLALNALPAPSGGRVVVLSGTYVFTALTTVTRVLDNITIEGMGRGSYITGDGVTAVFTAGGNNWKFSDLRTDVGGIAMGATTGWMWENVLAGAVYYTMRTAADGNLDLGGVQVDSFMDSGLTNGRIPIAGVAGLIGDDADLTWAGGGGNTLSATNATVSGLLDAQTGRGATLTVAASNATALEIAQADYVCDGVNDEAEINAAFAALPAVGGKVQLTEGLFNISDNVIPVSNSTLNGMGKSTRLLLKVAAGGIDIIRIVDGSLTGITISNIQFDGGDLHGPGETDSVALLVQGSAAGTKPTKILFTNNWVNRFTWPAVFVYSYSENIVITENMFWDNQNAHVEAAFVNAVGTVISNNTFYGTEGDSAIETNLSKGTVISGNTIFDVPRGMFLKGGYSISVTGNTLIGSAVMNRGIEINAGSELWNSVIANNTFRDISSGGGIKAGIYITGDPGDFHKNNVISGNTFSVCQVGIYVVAAAGDGFSNNLIEGNTFSNMTSYPMALSGNRNTVQGNHFLGSALGRLLYIQDGNYNKILDNTFDSNTQLGIEEVGGDYNYYIGNIFRDIGSTVIAFVGTHDIIDDNEGYISQGEIKTASGSLAAGVANAISFAWHNPELKDIFIKKVVVEITTGSVTAGSEIDVGIADDAAGTNRGTEFFNNLDANDVDINDSWVAGDGGTQTKWVFCQDSASATDGWVVGQILTADAAALVGKFYVEYTGR